MGTARRTASTSRRQVHDQRRPTRRHSAARSLATTCVRGRRAVMDVASPRSDTSLSRTADGRALGVRRHATRRARALTSMPIRDVAATSEDGACHSVVIAASGTGALRARGVRWACAAPRAGESPERSRRRSRATSSDGDSRAHASCSRPQRPRNASLPGADARSCRRLPRRNVAHRLLSPRRETTGARSLSSRAVVRRC